LAYGFSAFLLYSWLYQWFTRHLARPANVVIVLGSGLVRGRVPPLLASRLDAGARQFRRALVAGQSPVIIVSGGQGSDEPRSEAAAMAEYLTDQGLDPTAVWQETESRNTEQNLALSRELMATAGVTGRAAVVTNNFHAFRAALEMRDAKIRGYTIGAPTAGYYWPSATIREYAAILKRSRTFVIVIMAFAGLPLLLQVWYALIP
ncbi:MAG: YdcF family protein, partial [Propionibacteriaceae bacterium]|nr:YdcF family protein [Propionibacteriaceae bacterium]